MCTEAKAAEVDKFARCIEKAQATICLSVNTSLLYLLDVVDCPNVACQTLHDKFCRKTLANKLKLKRKLHSLRLDEGRSMQQHF